MHSSVLVPGEVEYIGILGERDKVRRCMRTILLELVSNIGVGLRISLAFGLVSRARRWFLVLVH